jgi:thiol:disulfide interchange protein
MILMDNYLVSNGVRIRKFAVRLRNCFPMTRFLFSFLLSLSSFLLMAQFASPISWGFSYERVEEDQYDLIATATADDGWAIYSQFTDEGGPVPTTFFWEEGDHYELVGKTSERGHKKEGMDDMFGVNVAKFLSDEPVIFTQRVRIKDYGTPIAVAVEFMCCDDEQCLPPTDEPYSWNIPAPGPDRAEVTEPAPTKEEVAEAEKPVITVTEVPDFEREEPKPEAVVASTETPSDFTVQTYEASELPPNENDPVTWVFRAVNTAPDVYRLEVEATMEPGWTIYSITTDPDIGPIPTEVVIQPADGLEIMGEVREESATFKKKYDAIWDAEVAKIDGGTVQYTQSVRVAGAEKITGYIVYQTCDDEACFMGPEVPFELDLSGATPVASIDGLTGDGSLVNTDMTSDMVSPPVAASTFGVNFDPEPVGQCSEGEAKTKGQGLWAIFGLGLLGGLFALIMPCIFPMIPLTVSFFTKSSGTKAQGIQKAALYGFFIFLIYVLLSLPFHIVDGLDPNLLNQVASNVWLNLLFFAVFMFFAGSFFGFYELTLPESWSNRASRAEGTGGVVGIFFMALTLALVSFSCTGPILGSLLVEAVSGGAMPLTAGMAGFGVALGLPFALFAAFPGVLKSMPKSGGWLNSVKVVLGFLEVALAFKFLSNADLVGNWEALRIEPFLIVWMLCSLGIAAYLFGFINFPLDSKNRKPGPIGLSVALAGIAFTAYLGFGFTNDPDTGNYRTLNLLSGIAPPVCYSYFNACDCPQNITCFKDLDEGLAYAREVNKPVMLDFTGYTCVNCRKMEENVWSEERIKRILSDDYVLISLYVDDRKALPEAEHQEVDRMDGTGRTRKIDEVGEKWQYLQQSVFSKASQPYYVLVSPEGTTLNPPVAYTPDVDEYENFLKCGLSTYEELQQGK